jgi:hypothetical protein
MPWDQGETRPVGAFRDCERGLTAPGAVHLFGVLAANEIRPDAVIPAESLFDGPAPNFAPAGLRWRWRYFPANRWAKRVTTSYLLLLYSSEGYIEENMVRDLWHIGLPFAKVASNPG